MKTNLQVAVRDQLRVSKLVRAMRRLSTDTRRPERLTAMGLVAMCEMFQGEQLAVRLMRDFADAEIPRLYGYLNYKRQQAVIREHLNGWAEADLAMRYGMTRRTVARLLREYRASKKMAEVREQGPSIVTLTGDEEE